MSGKENDNNRLMTIDRVLGKSPSKTDRKVCTEAGGKGEKDTVPRDASPCLF